MEGEVRSNKGEVMEEGLVAVVLLVVLQALNRMIACGSGGVIVLIYL